jgi:putative hydrolase
LLLFGCEANIIDTTGKLDLPDEWARRQRLLLAGLHERTPWPASTSRADNTRAILGALQNPAVHVIAHPYRPQFPIDVDTVVDAAVEHRKLLEINVSIFRGDLANAAAAGGDETVRATRCMLQRLQEKNGEFVVSTDAHHSSEVGVERRTLEALGALLEFDAERYRKNVMSMLQRQVPYLRDAARAAA